jgi:hypothetical protein
MRRVTSFVLGLVLTVMIFTACTQRSPDLVRPGEGITVTAIEVIREQTTPTHAPTQSPSPTSIPPTSTPIPTVTPASTNTMEPVIFTPDVLTGNEKEAVFFKSLDAVYFAYLDINDKQGLNIVSTALTFRFANHEQLVAYFDWENVWIADITNQRKARLFEYEYSHDRETQILWTPDDQHIIFDVDDGGLPAVIYNRSSGYFKEWPYRCDRIAISPQSNRIAIWCPADHDTNNWAIVEWGGEIWYDDKAPEKIIVKSYNFREEPLFPGHKQEFNRMPIYRNAAWSSQGDLIAFFDPEDQNGDLHIINEHGEEIQRYKARAYWLSKITDAVVSLPGFPLQWSQNNSKLLVYGVGEEGNPCPSRLRDGEIYENPACWQVLDLKKEQTIWNMKAFVVALPKHDALNPTKNEIFYIGNASISIEGQYLTFFCFCPPSKLVYTIDIDMDKIIDWSLVPDAQEIRWGLLSRK